MRLRLTTMAAVLLDAGRVAGGGQEALQPKGGLVAAPMEREEVGDGGCRRGRVEDGRAGQVGSEAGR